MNYWDQVMCPTKESQYHSPEQQSERQWETRYLPWGQWHRPSSHSGLTNLLLICRKICLKINLLLICRNWPSAQAHRQRKTNSDFKMNLKSAILRNLTWFTDWKLPLLLGSEIERKGKPKNKYQFTGEVLLEPINGSPKLNELFINATTSGVKLFKS